MMIWQTAEPRPLAGEMVIQGSFVKATHWSSAVIRMFRVPPSAPISIESLSIFTPTFLSSEQPTATSAQRKIDI